MHCVPTEVWPTFKYIKIQHSGTETYITLITLTTTSIYLMQTAQVSTKYTA